MSPRNVLGLLLALTLLAPLAAVAGAVCGPGQHCPMAGVGVDDPPCHGKAIRADDCCVTAASTEPAEVVPVVGASALAVGDAAPAPRTAPSLGVSPAACDEAPSTPLYRLFRALLI